MIRNLLLDLDGTLLDTEILYKRAMIEAVKKYDVQLSEQYAEDQLGNSLPDKSRQIISDFHLDVPIEDLMEHYKVNQYALIDEKGISIIYPDVINTLKELKDGGMHIYICTNSRQSHADHMLNYTEIMKYTDGIIYGDWISLPKPNPEIYLRLMDKYGMKPEECITVEDSLAGLKSSYAAGIYTVGIERRKPVDQNYCHKVIQLFPEIVEVIKEKNYDR